MWHLAALPVANAAGWFMPTGIGRPQRLQEVAEKLEQDAFPDKPRGMHWRTYDRLRRSHDAAGDAIEHWDCCNLSIARGDAPGG
jgi:hypothetical protein